MATTPARQSSIPVPSTSSPLSPDSVLNSSPPAAADFASKRPRQHSSRFSKDLAEIRKFTAAASNDGDSTYQPDETESNLDMDDFGPSGDDRSDRNASQDDLNAAAHSTLSKRADFILANAKKKLNVSDWSPLGLVFHYSYLCAAPRRQPRPRAPFASCLSPEHERASHSI